MVPVCFAKIRFGDATFNSVGRDIVYLPSYYVDREMQPANYPFLLDSRGRIHYYEPDTLNVIIYVYIANTLLNLGWLVLHLI